MPKKRRSRAFWKNFKFKYKLTIVNENTLEEIVGLRVSKLNGLSVLLSVLTVLFLIAACIIAFTPLRNYLPGYMNSEVRSQIVGNALRVASLQQVLNRQNLYIMNIQDIFSGNIPVDSVQTLDSRPQRHLDGTHQARRGIPPSIRRNREIQPDFHHLPAGCDGTYPVPPDAGNGFRSLRCEKETLRNGYCRQSQ